MREYLLKAHRMTMATDIGTNRYVAGEARF
jgi:hypothetical protein